MAWAKGRRKSALLRRWRASARYSEMSLPCRIWRADSRRRSSSATQLYCRIRRAVFPWLAPPQTRVVSSRRGLVTTSVTSARCRASSTVVESWAAVDSTTKRSCRSGRLTGRGVSGRCRIRRPASVSMRVPLRSIYRFSMASSTDVEEFGIGGHDRGAHHVGRLAAGYGDNQKAVFVEVENLFDPCDKFPLFRYL